MKAIRETIHPETRCPAILLALLILPALLVSCSDDSTDPTGGDDSLATITGKLLLPEPAPDQPYAVLLDDDLDGEHYITACEGDCCGGTEVSYSIPDVEEGLYYVYAIVRLVSDPGTPPEDGDLYGLYGGSLSDPPTAPNVSVPASGTVNVDLTMDVFHEDPGPSDGPVITWRPSNLLMHYNYSGGVLVSGTIYMGAECTGEDGDVEIIVRMYREGDKGELVGETSAVFAMEAGESYWLTATVLLSGDNHLNPYSFVWSSPSAAAGHPVVFYLVNCLARSIHGPYLD